MSRPADGRPTTDLASPASDAGPDSPPPSGSTCAPGGSGFDTSTAGVARDRKTCLAWERDDPARDVSGCAIQARFYPSALCWTEASKYCQALKLGGRGPWRLPTAAELGTIVVRTSSPSVDQAVFPGTVGNFYWTSEMVGAKVTTVDFNAAGAVAHVAGPDGPQAFRCVSGP